MKKRDSHKFSLSTTHIIALSFFIAIAIGTVLLMLPISSTNGQSAPLITALFTSTTSTCVTGLVVVNTFEYWSTFGHIVILFLIQFGGLGIIAFTTALMLLLRRKVSFKDRLLLQDAFNLNTMSGLVKFFRHVLFGTFLIEGIGAFLYCFTFVPEFGLGRGIWISVFTAVSAFCNAGIDIIGPDSLTPYLTNINVNLTTMFLIIMGGLGFIVWFDILDNAKALHKKNCSYKIFFTRLSLHTKIVLTTTLFLLVSGTVVILALEYTNPETIGKLSFGHKLIASCFESVTLRTAGFLTFSQKALRESTVLFSIILMFIGGSPVGTAGGVKTTTFALVIISAMAAIHGNDYGTAFNRRLPNKTLRKALAVILISMFVAFTGIILLATFSGGDIMDIMFEEVSAICTVGLSRNYTGALNFIGKIIIIVTMYLGRIGPITLALIFGSRKNKYGLAVLPKEDITVG